MYITYQIPGLGDYFDIIRTATFNATFILIIVRICSLEPSTRRDLHWSIFLIKL